MRNNRLLNISGTTLLLLINHYKHQVYNSCTTLTNNHYKHRYNSVILLTDPLLANTGTRLCYYAPTYRQVINDQYKALVDY